MEDKPVFKLPTLPTKVKVTVEDSQNSDNTLISLDQPIEIGNKIV